MISLFFVFQLIGNVNAQNKTAKLAKSRYSDPNGYFKIVPPDGWRIQKYPEDPRGKVAFIGPDGVELRILVKGLDYNSFEEMLEEIKGIEKKIDTNINIEKITFANKPAIKRIFTLKDTKMLDAEIKKIVFVEAYPIPETSKFLKQAIEVEPFTGFTARAFFRVFPKVN